MKEANDYLQQFQLLRKVKEKSVFSRPAAQPAGGEQRQAMASTPLFPFNSAQEIASWEKNLQQQQMTSKSMHTQCIHFFRINTCQSYVEQAKGMWFVLSPLTKAPLMVAGRFAKFVNT